MTEQEEFELRARLELEGRPVNEGIRNPVVDSDRASSEMANADEFTNRRIHEQRMANDPYYRTAQEQTPLQNFVAAVGGTLKGIGYIGPRQIVGNRVGLVQAARFGSGRRAE